MALPDLFCYEVKLAARLSIKRLTLNVIVNCDVFNRQVVYRWRECIQHSWMARGEGNKLNLSQIAVHMQMRLSRKGRGERGLANNWQCQSPVPMLWRAPVVGFALPLLLCPSSFGFSICTRLRTKRKHIKCAFKSIFLCESVCPSPPFPLATHNATGVHFRLLLLQNPTVENCGKWPAQNSGCFGVGFECGNLPLISCILHAVSCMLLPGSGHRQDKLL